MDGLWVECSAEGAPAGAGGTEPVPVRFGWTGAPGREVLEVLDRWHGEGHRYFRVRDDGGAVLILRHDTERDLWQLHFLELPAGRGSEPDPQEPGPEGSGSAQ